jgi:1,4-dihydroxy-2-naphthoate octaprenyltransferase
MNFLKFTRYSEWYESKLIPLLAIGYLVIYMNNYPLANSIPRLLFLIFSIVVGAMYVSVVNDFSDIKEDIAVGKKNRMQNMPRWKTALIFSILCIAGLCCGYVIYPDKLSLLFYTMAWIVFSLYSLYPFRLKERGIWGTFADASGAHLFPTLVIVCNLYFISGSHPDTIWLITTAAWALLVGLRGILYHQFRDRDNDIASHVNTFASRVDPAKFKIAEWLIFISELICFLIIIHTIIDKWLLILAIAYILLIFLRKVLFDISTIIILIKKDKNYQIAMIDDFYQVFFPLFILYNIAVHQHYGWILLCCHIILFPFPVYFMLKDGIDILKHIKYRLG